MPVTGILAQLGGDAHLANFGGFASPERRLVFDLNDFDETVRGPWEWDVKRLAVSIVLAGRGSGVRPATCADAVRFAMAAYRVRTREFAQMTPLDVWYSAIDVTGVVRTALTPRTRRGWERLERTAREHTAFALLPRITTMVDGAPRFVDDPPLLQHLSDEETAQAQAGLDAYRASVRPDARILLDRFHPVDIARKVVGVGSVGTWCALALFADARGAELLLQLKEARTAAAAAFVAPEPRANEAERVVVGQRLIQAASDVLLGYTQVGERCVYVRQYRDMKATVRVETLQADELTDYAGHCAWALARAHARTGDARATGAYLGNGAAFDEAMVLFANAYADQVERDHAEFVAAARPAANAG
jgi:uncharacterized protein (DUF2252 family)